MQPVSCFVTFILFIYFIMINKSNNNYEGAAFSGDIGHSTCNKTTTLSALKVPLVHINAISLRW